MTTFLRVDLTKWNIQDAAQYVQSFVDTQCSLKKWDPFSVQIHPSVPDCLFIQGRKKNVHPSEVEVYVDHYTGNAIARGADIFVAGVLAAESGMTPGQLVAVYVDIQGSCLRGQLRYNGKKIFLGNGLAKWVPVFDLESQRYIFLFWERAFR
jgi:predicted ribosome-associated RNA-binding protein Tma20